ncbi:HdeD family acid-resistance protein [Pseudooceanicola spongiae]|jgi:membrane protein HdeD|uniref:HdeD protein n=1 Tax=Pseudooceanicola spongiae TaxID=2613965 RepID=A0A7L9WRG2_9RHOB|nr:DUF308 domain-containing protein [Pseudooceanicola spongiae]QOL82462.1 hypothetical protein F3W81_17490 [Pseudooceanicola spongiae]
MRVSTILMIIGALLSLGGILALANPFAASMTVTTIVGVFFVFSGVVQAWILFRAGGVSGRFFNGFVALLSIVAGVWMLANPLAGTVSLTLILGVVFLIMGLVRLLMAVQLGQTRLRWIMMLSGIASVGIGLLVLFNIAAAASTLLGIFLGIQLLAEGIGLLAFTWAMRRKGH